MMYRSYDPVDLRSAMGPYLEETVGFYPEEWITDEKNIAMTDGNGNYNLFQYDGDGVYWGHTFYTARGREALRLAKECLHEVFSDDSPIKIIKGTTPLTKLGARWLNRQLGFVSHGVVQTVVGPEELFILDKPTYERAR